MSFYTLVFGGTVPFGAFLAMGATGLLGTAALFMGWRLRPR